MSEKIIISSDSTCDLSPELIERFNVKILPMHIVMGEQNYDDGENIRIKDVFDYAEKTGTLCKTTAINVAEYIEYYKEQLKSADAIIHFSISSEMSSTYSNSRIAANDFDNVYPVDSRELSTGIGLQVLKACELRDKGLSAQEIFNYIEQMKARIDSSFIIDTLTFLHKGGRCSGVAALGANLLKLKPCIEVKNGKMDVAKKYRGKLNDVFLSYIKEKLGDASDVEKDRIFITHTVVEESHRELVDSVANYIKENYNFKEVLDTTAGCTVGVHCGPDTLGILFVRK